MKTIDRFGGVLWLILGIFISIMSLNIGIGDLHKPKAGFTSLVAGVMLSVLGLILILNTFLRKFNDEKMRVVLVKEGIKDPLLALSALIGYVCLLEYLGFLITNFIFMMFLFKIKDTHKNWITPLILTISTVVVSYLVFTVWLGVQFPIGLLEFWG
jgi:putative tricarboxylic transport membrane protein